MTSLAAKARRAPLRIATGAFVLNTGLTKLHADAETARHVHDTAVGAYPILRVVEPRLFIRLLGAGEAALGAALLAPVVPARLAGAGLTGFAAGLLGVWWRTPGMHAPGSIRPTQQGTAIAKDSWLLGIGTGLMIDGVLADTGHARAARRTERKTQRKARRKAAGRAARRTRRRARLSASRTAARSGAVHTAEVAAGKVTAGKVGG